MEAWKIPIWSIISFLALGGLVFVAYGLRRCGFGQPTKTRQHEREISAHINSIMNKLEECQRDREELTNKRKQLEKSLDDSIASVRAYDRYWRIDDLDWTIDDLNWDIRDSRFEIDWRKEQEGNTRATFWAVLGAAVFALAGLIVDVLSIFY